jgi:DNA-binding LacI/PurR family transcriptional regulator
LTTVKLSLERAGAMLAETLFSRMETPDVPQIIEHLPCEFLEGQSVRSLI